MQLVFRKHAGIKQRHLQFASFSFKLSACVYDSGIHLLITANETIVCLTFILQHRYSFLCLLTMAINKIMIVF